MTMRVSKIALLAGVALFFTLVVFNNVTDYDSNYQFVRHVLAMDSTFPGNHGLWRHVEGVGVYRVFYLSIIATETVTAGLLWWGVGRLGRCVRAGTAEFERAKEVGIAGLTLACLLWLVAFLSVGGEWFLMWQSHTWNGQDAAFRMFTVCGVVLLYLSRGEQAADRNTDSLRE